MNLQFRLQSSPSQLSSPYFYKHALLNVVAITGQKMITN